MLRAKRTTMCELMSKGGAICKAICKRLNINGLEKWVCPATVSQHTL